MSQTVSNKALVLSAPTSKDGTYEVKTLPVPSIAPGQLLVKVAAAALNPADWKFVHGNYLDGSYPVVQGFDGAGTVEAIGDGATGFAKGDHV